MTNYRAILQYYCQGNTTTQIATICQCSRTTVLKTIKRAAEINLALPVADSISDKELYLMLYLSRGRKEEYYLPDWYELNKDKTKRKFTKYRAWQKYCRVAKKLGLKAYGKSRFYRLYKDYLTVHTKPAAKVSQILKQIRNSTFTEGYVINVFGKESNAYRILMAQREQWCKSLRLNSSKIWTT